MPPAAPSPDADTSAIASDLMGLLHENAPAEAFAARLAAIEALPDGLA